MPRSIIGAVLVVSLAAPLSAAAFDTRHHWDMTWNALKREGFSDAAIRVVVLQNWLTDFYAGQEDVPGGAVVRGLLQGPDAATVKHALWLHFDDLETPEAVDKYWDALAKSTAAELYRLARQKREDPLALLTTLGISLHAVQDFYTHSNWVAANTSTCSGETLPGLTWFDAKRLGQSRPYQVRTGSYQKAGSKANSHAAMNKDSAGRPCWAEAYTAAYRATRQWVRTFSAFLALNNRGDLWDRCVRGAIVTGTDADELERSLEVAYRASSAVGHWDGRLLSMYASFNEAFSFKTATSSYKLAFTKRSILATLSEDLQAGKVAHPLPAAAAAPVFEAVPDDENAVFVRIDSYASTNSPSDPLCLVNDKMPFVRLDVSAGAAAGQAGIAQTLRLPTDGDNCGQRPPLWKALWFAGKVTDSVEIAITLGDEGVRLDARVPPVEPFVVDLNPAVDAVVFHVTVQPSVGSCTIAGASTTCGQAITTEGTVVPRGRLGFRVSVLPIR